MKTMEKEEFLEEVKQKWYLKDVPADLVDRAIGEQEIIYGTLKHRKTVEEGVHQNTHQDTYYVVTNRRLFKFYLSVTSYGYKCCSLRLFQKYEERIVPFRGAIKSYEYFVREDFPGLYMIEIFFDIEDTDFKEISFAVDSSKERDKIERLKDFVKGFHCAITDLPQHLQSNR